MIMAHPTAHISPRLSQKKKLIFIAVTLFLPVLLVCLLELVLRVSGYGPDLSLCTKTTVRGVDYYAMNGGVHARYFSGRFFGGVNLTGNPEPEFFVMPKPVNTYRIFCLGGSTTAGYPFGVLGSFSQFLQDRLQKIFPDKNVEVIDFGITATNSFTVLDMARDAMEYQPDLIIVYDGHNEFYGALGIASRESAGRIRALGLAYMRLTHLKTFLLFNDVIDRIRSVFTSSSSADFSGTAMERLAKGRTIAYGSALYESGLEWYKENMNETARICRDHHVPVIFSSQVSNIRDLPPFVSEFSDAATAEQRRVFASEYDAGMNDMTKGDATGALVHFRAAINADSTRADARYQAARCLESTGDDENAHKGYLAARDLDQLRFRQSTDFNNAVNAMSGTNVFVCDCESSFTKLSPHGSVGNDLILEHLHPTLYGYFLLAKAYARTMKEHGLAGSASEWNARDTVSDPMLWSGKVISPLDEAIAARRIAILTSSWPFVQGPSTRIVPMPAGPIETIAKDVVEKKITWERGMVTAAEYYASQGKVNEAESCYRSLIVHTPFTYSPYLRLGELLFGQGKEAEGSRVLKQSLEFDPSHQAYQRLGRFAYDHHQFDEAIGMLDRSKQLAGSVDERTEASLGLALTYYQKGDLNQAKAEAEYILTFNPNAEQARQLIQFIQSSKQ
jgi:tetratricopeptide (TPR) repeat protein